MKNRYIHTSFQKYIESKQMIGESFFSYTYEDIKREILKFSQFYNHPCQVIISTDSGNVTKNVSFAHQTVSEIHILENDSEIADFVIHDDGENFHVYDKKSNNKEAIIDTMTDIITFIKNKLKQLWLLDSKQ